MAKAQAKILLVGDTCKVRYTSWRILDPETERNNYSGGQESNREPLIPVSARVRLFNFETNEEEQLGATTVYDEAVIEGNLITYLIPADKFEEGQYMIYMQCTYADGDIKTEKILVRAENE